jgi:hypothetical protein
MRLGQRTECSVHAQCSLWEHPAPDKGPGRGEPGEAGPHFFSSHLEGMKRRLGSGPWCSEWISGSRVNQSTSGSYGFTCARSRARLARARSGSPCSNAHTTDNNSKTG